MLVEDQGFTLHKAALSPSVCAKLLIAINKLYPSDRYCIRDILCKHPELVHHLKTPIMEKLLGGSRIVRSVLFRKPPDKNWWVPWHQDALVQVLKKQEHQDWQAWSLKENRWHVQPPAQIMQQVTSLRIHLTACGQEDGPLRVIPQSHTDGYQECAVANDSATTITAQAGDVLAMSPLLIHASSPVHSNAIRAVLHLEICSGPLPSPFTWAAETVL